MRSWPHTTVPAFNRVTETDVMFRVTVIFLGLAATAGLAGAQPSTNPFPTPIESAAGIVAVKFAEFATIPDAANGEAPRMMHMLDEPGTRRMFVSTMRGGLYSLSYDGKSVTEYLDINAEKWSVPVQAQGSERGFQSFAFHPEFSRAG